MSTPTNQSPIQSPVHSSELLMGVPTQDSSESNEILVDSLTFQVPLKPTALQRPRFIRKGPRAGHVYDPSSTDKKKWMNCAQSHLPCKPMTGPLKITLKFYYQRPKSHYRTGKYSHILKSSAPHHHYKMPDLDNLVKFVLDAMNARFFEDDRQICEIIASKHYTTDSSYTSVHLETISDSL